MILKLMILVSLCQIILYIITDRLKIKYLKIIILFSILFAYFFVLPKYFYPEPSPDGVNCGMPILGVNIAFWVFGTFIAFLSHLVYYYVVKKKNDDR